MNLSALQKRLDRMPMLKLFVPLAAGMAVSEHYETAAWLPLVAGAVAGVAALLLRSSPLTVATLFVAGFGTAQFRRVEPAVPRDLPTTFALEIDDIPSLRGSYTVAKATLGAWRDPATDTWHASGDRVVLYADSTTTLAAGERLHCQGCIRPFRSDAEGYRRLMRHRGYAGTLAVGESTILRREPAARGSLHRRAVGALQRLDLPADGEAVVRAMVAGDGTALSREVRTAFSRSGFAHLLAVSGLHTGLLFLVVNLLARGLLLLRHGHLLRNTLVIAAVWLFVALADFPPSAVRAAVMCTLLQLSLAASSEYVSLNALSAAAVGMLLWNPAWLHDPGFQLSFVAVAGILVWGIPLCRRCRTRFGAVNAVIDAYAVGLVATVATLPLVAHTFSMLPLAGIVLNPVAILLAMLVVPTGLLALLVPFAAPLFGWLLTPAAEGLVALARLTAAIPGGVVDVTFSGGMTAALYLLFVAATLAAWCCQPKKSVHLPLR